MTDVAPRMETLSSRAVVSVIRRLGFVGGSHYCPDCMNTFHGDKGQHEPDCSYHKITEDEWLDDWEHEFPREPRCAAHYETRADCPSCPDEAFS